MVDFLIRIVVGAIVGSLVSAGILIFAFDQSMRGMEAAINAQVAATTENGNWIRSIDAKFDALNGKLDDQSSLVTDKLNSLAIGISGSQSEQAIKEVFWIENLADLQEAVINSSAAQQEIFGIMIGEIDRNSAEYGRLEKLIEDIERQQAYIKSINFEGAVLVVSPKSETP